ncbi:MAG: HAD family hydrolase [Micavibrio aeruginosavorus]|uniref:phosphoglycolate phosphatase n=1 Tax=Micavibrio aeruginosavorus TaxID=349221 RepID=A0A2W5BU85_9BACT|nr:MAG: HAD family hydrolase [Micavibrio aeruginosavorus]
MIMKGVYFDWDGTLVDSLPLLYASHNHVRVTMGLHPWTREEYMQAMVHSTRELYPTIYGNRAQEAQDMLYQFISDNHLQQLSLIDGAKDVLDMLQGAGIPMGLVSNKRNDILRREVEHLGWQGYFGVYNGAGVASADKPSGAPLLYALSQDARGLKISDIIYVGDTESDLSCAADAGCPVVFIRGHAPKADELIAKYKPAYIVHNLMELQEILQEFLGLAKEKKAC